MYFLGTKRRNFTESYRFVRIIGCDFIMLLCLLPGGSKMSAQSKTFGIVVDFVLTSSVALAIVLIYFFLSIYLASSFALLVGIWFIDAYLKKSFEYPNETLFADLSFAAFIFFAGQRSDILLGLTGTTVNPSSYVRQILPFILVLGALWLGNLRVCRALLFPDKYLDSTDHVPYVWSISLAMAFVSTVVALLPQILELI